MYKHFILFGISVKTKLNKTTQILFSHKLDKTIVYQ